MIAKAAKAQSDVSLEFDHVFSCEIEPFKQAYIERNFAPPILFRDVTELGGDKAHTAYGSLVDVPGNVDVCCSCDPELTPDSHRWNIMCRLLWSQQ